MLAARSLVFAQLLEGRWKGKRSARLTHATDEASVDALLGWIYSGELMVEDESENLRKLAKRVELLDPMASLLGGNQVGGTVMREQRKQQMMDLQVQFAYFTHTHILVNAQRDVRDQDVDAVARSMSKTAYCDAILQVNDNTLYPIHRAILCQSRILSNPLPFFSRNIINFNITNRQTPILTHSC